MWAELWELSLSGSSFLSRPSSISFPARPTCICGPRWRHQHVLCAPSMVPWSTVWAAARRCLERVDVDGGMTRSRRAWQSQSLRTYCSLGRSLERGLWEEVKCLQVEVSCRGFTQGNVWCWQTPNAQRFQEHHWWCDQEHSQMKPFSSAPHFNIQHLVLPHIYALLSRCQEYKCTITEKTDLQNCIPLKYKKKSLKKSILTMTQTIKCIYTPKGIFFF